MRILPVCVQLFPHISCDTSHVELRATSGRVFVATEPVCPATRTTHSYDKICAMFALPHPSPGGEQEVCRFFFLFDAYRRLSIRVIANLAFVVMVSSSPLRDWGVERVRTFLPLVGDDCQTPFSYLDCVLHP